MHGGHEPPSPVVHGVCRLQRPKSSGLITTRAFETAPLNRLEALARSLWCFFLVYSLGHMATPWIGFCRTDLVESIVAPAPYDSIGKFKQKTVG